MRVAAIVGELMFASRVQGILERAGHDVTLVSAPEAVADADVVVADLMEADAAALVATGLPVLGIFNHTFPDVRDQALAAGVTIVVPRSRFVREAAELVDSLAPGSAQA
ncbi:MAG: hypothetical protein QOF12_2653 [Solirubrobacteraceae bacterium]|nr:hypothetical protein [Solirubrobacteraceae bacterium]